MQVLEGDFRSQITTLAAQASISFINNKGDIGKTLKELGSSQTVKAAIAAALNAGVLDKLGNANGMVGGPSTRRTNWRMPWLGASPERQHNPSRRCVRCAIFPYTASIETY